MTSLYTPTQSEEMDSTHFTRTPIDDPYALSKTCDSCPRKLINKTSIQKGRCSACRPVYPVFSEESVLRMQRDEDIRKGDTLRHE